MADTILVTGLSGFIAKHVALALLAKGYAVRGTVRSAAKGASVIDALAAAGGDRARLSLVEADLDGDKGWREAAGGVAGVIHVASPFPIEQPRDRNALVPAARGGALRVIDAALDAGVSRIVMTSSMAAMMYRPGRAPEFPVTENDWTDVDWRALSAYIVSKTEAERAAWARVEERGARGRLAVVNPGFVLGPTIDKEFGTSLAVLDLFFKGAYPAVPPVSYPIVDVRDAAAVHVAAMERAEAGGRRLIASADSLSMKDIAAILREVSPAHAKKLPASELPAPLVRLLAVFDRRLASLTPDLGSVPRAQSAYVTELTGVPFRSAREAVEAGARSVIAAGAA